LFVLKNYPPLFYMVNEQEKCANKAKSFGPFFQKLIIITLVIWTFCENISTNKKMENSNGKK